MKDNENSNNFSAFENIYVRLEDDNGIDDYELIDTYVLEIGDITRILTNYYWKFEHDILPNNFERIIERSVTLSFKGFFYNEQYLPKHSKKVNLPFPGHNITFHGDELVDDYCYTFGHLNK